MTALVIGEALIDIVSRDGASTAHPGGSPMNVAVGLARLGVPALLHSSIGADAHGRLIEEHLAASGVRLSAESVGAAPTSVAEAVVGADGAAGYTFDVSWAPLPLPLAGSDDVSVVHTGSIAAVLEPGRQLVRDTVAARRARSTISFDPNVRPRLMGSRDGALRVIRDLVQLADVVKASDEDVHWLYPGRGLAEAAAEWQALGPAVVVVTRGADGALAVSDGDTVEVPAPATALVDTVGAGDSFMAAMLADLHARGLTGGDRRTDLAAIDRETLVGVIEFAARCAAITVSRAGANPPFSSELG
jgi:fructokinase